MILELNEHNPQPRRVQQVVQVLLDGGVVAYPTDTTYGLGCDIFNKKALRRLHQITGQPADKPFSFICPDLKDLSQYARVTNYAYKTLKRLLPGPFTFVLEGSREVPKMMLTRRKTAGIRVPDHPVCQAIVRGLGRPLVNATASGEDGAPLMSPWEIEDLFGHALDLVVDGGPVEGQESSVVSLVGDEPEVLRAGAGDVSEFEAA